MENKPFALALITLIMAATETPESITVEKAQAIHEVAAYLIALNSASISAATGTEPCATQSATDVMGT
jgi:hypothetical protein